MLLIRRNKAIIAPKHSKDILMKRLFIAIAFRVQVKSDSAPQVVNNPKPRRSSWLTHIAATGSVSLCERMKS
jgi:hypothetical protein